MSEKSLDVYARVNKSSALRNQTNVKKCPENQMHVLLLRQNKGKAPVNALDSQTICLEFYNVALGSRGPVEEAKNPHNTTVARRFRRSKLRSRVDRPRIEVTRAIPLAWEVALPVPDCGIARPFLRRTIALIVLIGQVPTILRDCALTIELYIPPGQHERHQEVAHAEERPGAHSFPILSATLHIQ